MKGTVMTPTYDTWIAEVKAALDSINMPMDDWQNVWSFEFREEFQAGTTADQAAMKANRFWWHQQNKSTNQDCKNTPNCWLPRNHRGDCQPL